MSQSPRESWLAAPPDPDPWDDLGYEFVSLTVVRAPNSGGQLVFLPEAAEQLEDDEFIVAAPDSVRSLDDCQ